MIAKPEMAKNHTTKQQPRNQMGATTNIELTALEPRPMNGQQPSPGWDRGIYYTGQLFALDSVVVKTPKMLSSHAVLLTYAMYHPPQRKNLTYYDELQKTM